MACWGQAGLGDGGTIGTVRTVPAVVGGLPAPATSIAAGWLHSCASMADGSAWCWGYGFQGQIGDGTNLEQVLPVGVTESSPVLAAGVGSYHSCFLLDGGRLSCTGQNDQGQLGNGLPGHNRPVPATVITGPVT